MEAEMATSQCGSRPHLRSARQRVVQEAWLVMPHDLCKVMLSSLQARLGNGVIVLALPTLQGEERSEQDDGLDFRVLGKLYSKK